MTENKEYKKHVNIFLTQYVLKTHLLEKGNRNYMKLAFNEKVHIFFSDGRNKAKQCAGYAYFLKKRISNILSHYDINTMITKGNTLKFKSILHEIMEYC